MAEPGDPSPPPRRLPPGQYVPRGWPVLHYGRAPKVDLESWDLRVIGATADASAVTLDYGAVLDLPQSEVVADLHCVTKFSLLGSTWSGIRADDFVKAFPPDPAVTHVMVYAEYGYSANFALEDFLADGVIFAHSRNGEQLSVEHGWPLRLICPHLYAWKSAKWVRCVEYLVGDRRGFWEERGYHNLGRVWHEERYSYQERPGDGPDLPGLTDLVDEP